MARKCVDLKKAFDTVPHIVFMNKLKLLGIPTPLLHWLFSYLHGRFQRVVVEGKTSSCDKAFSVPQESVLGPLLFLIYIHDISLNYVLQVVLNYPFMLMT